MSRPPHPRVLAVGLTLGALALVAACGGSDDKPTAAPNTSAPVVRSAGPKVGSDMEGTPDAPEAAASGTTVAGATAPATTAAGSPAAGASGDLPEACKLVTQAEADALGGTKLNPANQVADSCTFTGPTEGSVAQVEVFVGDGAKKFLDIDRELEHQFTPVTGAGDEAYYEENTAFARKGTVWVALRLTRLNDPVENQPKLESLLRTITSRM